MSAFPEADNCDFGDECPLVATATVKVNGVVATQAEVSTPLMPDPLCGFEFYYDAADDFVSDPVEVSDLCIWTLPGGRRCLEDRGMGDHAGPNATQKPEATDQRIGDGSRRRPGQLVPTRHRTPLGHQRTMDRRRRPFPPARRICRGMKTFWDSASPKGCCINGGAGGDYFAVGNPKSFYLAANGTVTVKWIEETPESPEPTPIP